MDVATYPTNDVVRAEVSSQLPANTPVKKKRIRKKTPQRREQCRIYQARYRNREKVAILDLEVAIHKLHTEVMAAEKRRDELKYAATAIPDISLRDAVAEFFTVIRHGFRARPPPPALGLTDTDPPYFTVSHQLKIVERMFDSGVRVGDAAGRTVFVKQLCCVSSFFDDPLINLRGLVYPSTPRTTTSSDATCIRAQGTIEMTISSASLQHVFPVLQDPANQRIAAKLLGERLQCALMASFVFDTDGFAVQFDWEIDFVAALVRILGVHDTAKALTDARITGGSYFAPEPPPGRSQPQWHARYS